MYKILLVVLVIIAGAMLISILAIAGFGTAYLCTMMLQDVMKTVDEMRQQK